MRRQRSPTHPAARSPRPPRRVPDVAAGSESKLPEGTACPRCEASYRKGRWTWKAAPAGSPEHMCPACERIEGRYPAGVLHVDGAYAAEHRDELIALLHHLEEHERLAHPLKRIMSIEDEAGGFVVETTDAKLAEALGRALHKAHAGSLEHPPTTAEKQNLVRIRWSRDGAPTQRQAR